MSQWTHILGVIRYDSLNMNVWPKPANKDKIVHQELDIINAVWQSGVPEGSEGPLQVDCLLTNRGPTVLLTGDLRDFGRPEIQEILQWAQEMEKVGKEEMIECRCATFIRDGIIRCDVEFDRNIYIITHSTEDEDSAKWGFVLKTLQQKEQ